jgi:hypothetical protein
MGRALVLLLLLAALAAPATALGQGDAFGPLPQPGQQTTPEPTPTPEAAGQQTVSRTMLLGIAGAVLAVFVGIGVYISRDARRNLSDEDRRAVAGERPLTDPERLARSNAAKQRARAAGKRQRQARKAQRRR